MAEKVKIKPKLLPTLEEIQKRRGGKELKFTYKTVEEVPVCEVEGIPLDKYLTSPRRAFIESKDGKDYYLFQSLKTLEGKPIPENWTNPTDEGEVLKRLQAWFHNFKYSDMDQWVEVQDGTPTLKAKQVEKEGRICRSSKKEIDPKTGKEEGYRFWVYKKNEIFDNGCSNLASSSLRPLPTVTLTPEEIIRIAVMTNLSVQQYCISQDLSTKFFITNHLPTMELIKRQIVKGVEERSITLERAKEIINDLSAAVAVEQETLDRQRRAEGFQADLRSQMLWTVIIGSMPASLLGLAGMLYVSGRIQFKRALSGLRNLTKEAKEGTLGKLEYYRSMTSDLKKMAEILGSPQINTPRTIGPNGTGKSARWEALALCIVEGKFPDGEPIPDHLKGRPVYEMTPKINIMGEEGSSYIGSAERLIRRIAKAINKIGGILHIDEAHTLYRLAATGREGAQQGGAEQGLKPLMARETKGRLGMSTTDEEYEDTIRRDKPLHGRTVLVTVQEPTPEETITIMRDKRGLYETNAGRKISDGAIRAAVELSLSDETTNYPRKAETVLNLTGSGMKKMDPNIEMTEEHVGESVRKHAETALGKAIKAAVTERNEAETTLPPEQAARVRRVSITMAIQERVVGFDGEGDTTQQTKLGRIVTIVSESWDKAVKEDPKIKTIYHPPEGTPHAQYIVPEDFTDVVLEQIATAEAITLHEDHIVAAKRAGSTIISPEGEDGGGQIKPPSAGVATKDNSGVYTVRKIHKFFDLFTQKFEEFERLSGDKQTELISKALVNLENAPPGTPIETIVEQIGKSEGLTLKKKVGPRGGNPKDGAPPPAVTGGEGSGEAQGARASEKPETESKRVGDISNGVKRVGTIFDGARGFTAVAAPLVILDAASHKDVGVLSENGRQVADLGFVGMLMVADPLAPFHLALMAAPFEFSKRIVQLVADKTGIQTMRQGSLTNTVMGTLGGLAGTSAVVKATGGAEVWHQASVVLTSKAGTGMYAAEQALVNGIGAVRQAIPQALQALRQAGPALAGAATAVGAVVTSSVAMAGAAVLATGALTYAAVHYSGLGDWFGKGSGLLAYRLIHGPDPLSSSQL